MALTIWAYALYGSITPRPYKKIRLLCSSTLNIPARPPRPQKINGNPKQNDLQTLSRCLCLVEQEHKHNCDSGKDIECRNNRVAERAIRPLRIRPFCAQHKNPDDR